MRKLLVTAALAAAFILPAQAAPQDYHKIATAMKVWEHCVLPNAEKEDPIYVSDGIFAIELMRHGVSEQRVNEADGAVQKVVKDIGVKEFCRRNKPSLDKAIETARKKYPDESIRNLPGLQRILGGGKK